MFEERARLGQLESLDHKRFGHTTRCHFYNLVRDSAWKLPLNYDSHLTHLLYPDQWLGDPWVGVKSCLSVGATVQKRRNASLHPLVPCFKSVNMNTKKTPITLGCKGRCLPWNARRDLEDRVIPLGTGLSQASSGSCGRPVTPSTENTF